MSYYYHTGVLLLLLLRAVPAWWWVLLLLKYNAFHPVVRSPLSHTRSHDLGGISASGTFSGSVCAEAAAAVVASYQQFGSTRQAGWQILLLPQHAACLIACTAHTKAGAAQDKQPCARGCAAHWQLGISSFPYLSAGWLTARPAGPDVCVSHATGQSQVVCTCSKVLG